MFNILPKKIIAYKTKSGLIARLYKAGNGGYRFMYINTEKVTLNHIYSNEEAALNAAARTSLEPQIFKDEWDFFSWAMQQEEPKSSSADHRSMIGENHEPALVDEAVETKQEVKTYVNFEDS